VNVDIKNNRNETALHLASKRKDFPSDLFNLILEKSKDINSQGKSGRTALHWAIRRESEIMTKALLAHNDVDVNVKDNDNETALIYVSMWKDIPSDLFNLFLEKSDDINAQNKVGDTALHWAIRMECKIATKALLNHKDVNVNVRNADNHTPLHFACLNWKNIPVDLFNLILEKSTDLNAQYDGALLYAIRRESEIATKELLKHKDVSVNVKNNDNHTPLHFASWWKDIPMDSFKIILEKTMDINAQDHGGDTALHFAIRRESEIKTKELLARKDVNVNVTNNYRSTPLHFASMWPNIPADLFKIILENTTNVNAQDEDGNTALHVAIFFKSEITTKILLAHNDVDVNIKNNDNETALSYASKWKDIPMDLFQIILERSTNEVEKISKMDRLSKYLRNLTGHK
jgi:E3 ubiquitin-protein ligase mind-bomb